MVEKLADPLQKPQSSRADSVTNKTSASLKTFFTKQNNIRAAVVFVILSLAIAGAI